LKLEETQEGEKMGCPPSNACDEVGERDCCTKLLLGIAEDDVHLAV
jgi:hypothetical protein